MIEWVEFQAFSIIIRLQNQQVMESYYQGYTGTM